MSTSAWALSPKGEGWGRGAARTSPWLRSAVWDLFWLHSWLWLLVPVSCVSAVSWPWATKGLLVVATLLFWLSHRFATMYTAFCTPAYRHLLATQRGRFLMGPLGIFLVVFGFVFAPDRLLPLGAFERAQVLGTIGFVWNTYHFAIQHYGVLSIYRLLAGQRHSGWPKRYEKYFCLIVGVGFISVAGLCEGIDVAPDLFLCRWLPPALLHVMEEFTRLVAPLTILALTAVFYVAEFKHEASPSVPKILYLSGFALQGILTYVLEPLASLVLWSVQHWMASLGLAAHMAQNAAADVPVRSRWYAFWNRLSRRFWPTVLILCAVSLLLTPLFEYAVRPEQVMNWVTGRATSLAFLVPILANQGVVRCVLGFSFASLYVHFLMDRAVFRFSDAAVRRVSVPLLIRPVLAHRSAVGRISQPSEGSWRRSVGGGDIERSLRDVRSGQRQCAW